MKSLVQFLLAIIILIIASAFAALNDQPLSLNYFIGVANTQLTYIIIACFILGALVSLLILMTFIVRGRIERRRLRNALAVKNQELSNLREAPIKDNF